MTRIRTSVKSVKSVVDLVGGLKLDVDVRRLSSWTACQLSTFQLLLRFPLSSSSHFTEFQISDANRNLVMQSPRGFVGLDSPVSYPTVRFV